MSIFGKILTAFLFFFFLFFTTPSTADIISVKIRSHNQDIIRFSDFKYSQTGYVSVAVSSVGISSIPITSNLSQPDPSRMGFFLLSDELRDRYKLEFKQNVNLCALDIKFISVLFTFGDLSPPPLSSFNKSYNVTFSGTYSLYFTNCNDLSLVTMDVRTELYNTDDDGATKDYLSADQTQPSYYFNFFFVYLCFLGFWISVCFNNRQYCKGIHLLMTMLLVTTLLHCICLAADKQDLKVTGTHNHGLRVLLYASQLIRNAIFSSVILLIGAGWCIWQPSFPVWAINNVTSVNLLQVWATVTSIAIGESGPYNKYWMDLNLMFYLVQMSCCFVVFFLTLLSAFEFVDARDTSRFARSFDSLEGTSARPDVFPFLFLVFTFFRSMNFIWPVIEEICYFVFLMVMFCMFRPFDLDNINEGKKCDDMNNKGKKYADTLI